MRKWARRISWTVGVALAIVVVSLASLWGHVYRKYHAEWQAEQQTITALNAAGIDTSRWEASGPRMVARLSSGRWLDRFTGPMNYLLYRVSSINADSRHLTDGDLANVSKLKMVTLVNLQNSSVTDDQLVYLEALRHLFRLSLNGDAGITDAGLVHLGRMKNLTVLSLSDTSITDAGLAQLGQMAGLVELGLRGTKVTDAGLQYLVGLEGLGTLDLSETGVSDQRVDQLQKTLPKLRIIRSAK